MDDLRTPLPRFVNVWYALGFALLTFLALQVASGLLLALHYQPTPAGAYESVRHITDEVPLGWLVRSLHHWGASVIVLLALLHMGRVLWTGAYRPPRETTWVAGFLSLSILLAFGLTGYLLPWDEVAYWGTTVVTDSFGTAPLVGPILLQVARGGAEVGAPTLLRFYILHIVVLPAALAVTAASHVVLVRHFGTAPRGRKGDPTPEEVSAEDRAGGRPLWPDQVLRELPLVYLLLAVAGTVAVVAVPELGPPADPFSTPEGIKPEWYFLPVYQLFKYIPSVAGTLLTGAAGLVLVTLPWWDPGPLRWLPGRPIARLVAVGSAATVLVLGLLGGLSHKSHPIGAREVVFDMMGVPSLRPLDTERAAFLRYRRTPSDSLATMVGALLDERCAGCHGGPYPFQDLDLSFDIFAETTVGVPSRQTGDLLVLPGRPDDSYLVRKLTGAEGMAGNRMPALGSSVEGEELALLRAWISGLPPLAAGPATETGDPRTGALILLWAVLGFGAYAAWMKSRHREGSSR